MQIPPLRCGMTKVLLRSEKKELLRSELRNRVTKDNCCEMTKVLRNDKTAAE
jgi:hypothetical protein